MEQKRRRLLRVISWRITATVTTMLISWLITNQIDLAIKIGFIEVFAKIVLQYIHERVWTKVKFGMIKSKSDYQI